MQRLNKSSSSRKKEINHKTGTSEESLSCSGIQSLLQHEQIKVLGFFFHPKLFFTIKCHRLQIVPKLGVVLDLAEGGGKNSHCVILQG